MNQQQPDASNATTLCPNCKGRGRVVAVSNSGNILQVCPCCGGSGAVRVLGKESFKEHDGLDQNGNPLLFD